MLNDSDTAKTRLCGRHIQNLENCIEIKVKTQTATFVFIYDRLFGNVCANGYGRFVSKNLYRSAIMYKEKTMIIS